MANPWKEKVQRFMANVQNAKTKSSDMDIILQALSALPPGQLKKLLSDDVVAIMEKYGYM